MSLQAVSSLNVKRTGRYTFKLEWKYAKDSFNTIYYEEHVDKVMALRVYARYSWWDAKKGTVYSKWTLLKKWGDQDNLQSITNTTLNVRGVGSLYPEVAVKKLIQVQFRVETDGFLPAKTYYDGSISKWRCSKYKGAQMPREVGFSWDTPAKPAITKSFNAGTGVVSFRVKQPNETEKKERVDTRYRVTRQDSANRGNSYKAEKSTTAWTTSTSTDFTLTYDVADHQSITQAQWIKMRCYAFARGPKGDSDTAKSEHMIAHPAEATIPKITATSASNGVVTVSVKMNKTETRPVEQAKLQRLTNTTIGTAATAAASLDWGYVDNAVDNGNCTGFTDQKSDAMPDVRKHTWYRVETKYGNNYVYGMPVEAKCLYRARDAASGQAITFRSITLNEEGDGVKMELGWPTDNYTENEVTWSTYEDAWESNKRPESVVMDWEDATPASGYAHSGTFVIRGLEPDQPCYVRVRRRFDNGDVVTHGEWNTPAKQYYPVDIGGTMGNVVLYAPESVVRDDGIDLQWEFDGDSPTDWYVYRINGSSNTTVASGKGPAGRCTVPASKLAGLASITLRVGLKSGGNMVYSSDHVVGIFDVPEATVDAPATLTAQPLSLDLTSTLDGCGAKVYVTASGSVSNYTPDDADQVAGDIIWAEYVRPTWAAASGGATGYTSTITAHVGLAFVDGCDYDVSVVLVDESTGLSSEDATDSTTVAWAHQAEGVGDGTELTVDQTGLTVTIAPEEPENAEESATYALTEDTEIDESKTYYTRSGSGTEQDPYVYTAVEEPSAASLSTYYERTLGDVCDVYRVTPDGCVLVYDGLRFGEECVDGYAPFSDPDATRLAYRLCTRTADGDLAWSDHQYALDPVGIRIDWDEQHVELPWDIAGVDAYAKEFELSKRWDGTRVGNWDAGATRTASLTTDVIAVDDETQASLLRELAQYAGPCFVRTPDGCAYEADVQVNSYGAKYGSPVIPVSIRATEVSLTGEFMARLKEQEA